MNLCEFDEESGCMLWIGYRTPRGHPQFKPYTISTSATRFIYQYFYGKLSSKRKVTHRDNCQNTSCVNPEHLRSEPESNIRKRAWEAKIANGHRRLQSHCIRGHVLNKETTYVHTYKGRKIRRCKACRRMSAKRYRDKRRCMKQD